MGKYPLKSVWLFVHVLNIKCAPIYHCVFNVQSPSRAVHAVLARFRVVRLVMQNQKTSLINIFAIKFYPSRLSRKNLIALFMKEQPI